MTTIQIQKTCNAEPITKTAIDQKQSLEVVQTMLHGSLSTLTYCRALFAEHAFDTQIYDMAQNIHSYTDYAAGKLVKHTQQATKPHTFLRTLRRGRSRRVDKFLNWLEKGAFVPLKAGHLHALQVYVHGDTDRSKVLETYTFTFQYNTTTADSPMVSGFELNGSDSPLLSVQATNAAFQSMMLRLMELCPKLPILPVNRYISMELFYVPGVEQQYRPRDFMPSVSDSILLPVAEGWVRDISKLPLLHSRFHDSTFKVTALVDESMEGYTQAPETRFPEIVEYTMISKAEAITWQPAGPLTTDAVSTVAPVTPSTIVEAAQLSQHGAASVEPFHQHRQTNAPLGTTFHLVGNAVEMADQLQRESVPGAIACTAAVDTSRKSGNRAPTATNVAAHAAELSASQSSNVKGMHDVFCNMMHPEQISQGETQILSQIQHLCPPARTTVSPTCTTTSPTKTSFTFERDDPTVVLEPTKASELRRLAKGLQKNAIDVIKRQGTKNLRGDLVLCQCGHDKEEDGMVQCAYCKTWQHLPCYGYTGVDDPRLPDDHTCYQCLLGEHEQATLVKLKDLALKRRVMDFAVQRGLRSQKRIAEDLGLQQNQARFIMNFLRDQGYVVNASGSHKKSYTATKKPTLVAVTNGASHELMMQNLFDPLTHIAHHYKLPNKPMSEAGLTQRLLASQAADMPPPATPALHLRKRIAATPGSCLDLRDSVPPYETPSRPRHLQTETRKRSAEHDSAGMGFKRFRSMETRSFIDASGLASSPAL
ncbi:hypothetical protein LTR62_003227 [Meristemomyces frigidus]|uniref:HORMA domain-containing protein n=1 Tax=Meristemomyces frigidus TaxID=1508187 RepID=A0AAN7TJ23_9PEZI|nr:hypothetical protein LTR62_003227 [Meristemomyces frigidus]